MNPFQKILQNTRPFALVALVGASLALSACGGGGGGEEDPGEEVKNFTVLSSPELDGSVVGTGSNDTGFTDVQPFVGDFAASGNNAQRAIAYYSFDISDLPEDAVIVSATLSLFNRASLGDPDEMMVLIRVDHVNYGNVFPQTLLGANGLDFNFATINEVNQLGRVEIDIAEQLQADIDAGRTRSQYRLRGAIASDLDDVADLALFTDGEDSFDTGELPMLLIEIE